MKNFHVRYINEGQNNYEIVKTIHKDRIKLFLPESARIISAIELPFDPTNVIGTDVSLEVCFNEGYLMMDTEGHKELQPGFSYDLFSYYPEHMPKYKNERIVNVSYSWDDIIELYTKYKTGIDSFADDCAEIAANTKPSFHHLLSLADSINAYRGL